MPTFGPQKGPPKKTPPIERIPIKPTSTKSPPIKTTPIKQIPIQNPPIKTIPMKTTPVQNPPSKTIPIKQTPVQNPPSKTIPMKTNLPIQNPPIKTIPMKTTPIQNPPMKTIPVKTPPIKTDMPPIKNNISSFPASPLKSVSRIQFDDTSETLFVVDWKRTKLYAFILPPVVKMPVQAGPPGVLNIKDLGEKLGIDATIELEDVRIRPNTYDAFVALSIGRDKVPIIVEFRVDDECLKLQGGSYKILPLALMPHTISDINDAPLSDQLMFEPEPIQASIVTDIRYHAPEKALYLSGLSGLESAHTIRIIEFPFTGKYKTRCLSSYNTSHQQWENHAPIRHFDVLEVNLEQWGDDGTRLGKQKEYCLVAALLCTPLAYIPLKELHAGGEKMTIKTRTFAEIGSGGTPLSFIKYHSPGAPQFGVPGGDMVIINSLYRNSVMIPWATIENAINGSKDGITRMIEEECMFDGSKENERNGMNQVLCGPVFRMALMPDLSGKGELKLVGLRRDLKTGAAQLVSYDPMTCCRLTDMAIEEYWWKNYEPEPTFFNALVAKTQNGGFKTEGYPQCEVKVVEPKGGSMPGGRKETDDELPFTW